MIVNIRKYKILQFNLIKNLIIFNYSILSFYLKLVSNLNRLGVIFNLKLNFSYHTESIKNKAMRILGFIKHSCKDFRDLFTLKILHWSLVYLNLEYYLLIWIDNT